MIIRFDEFFAPLWAKIILIMALIKSISGIRGTIGGKPGESLSPPDVVKFTAAYGMWLKRRHNRAGLRVIDRKSVV